MGGWIIDQWVLADHWLDTVWGVATKTFFHRFYRHLIFRWRPKALDTFKQTYSLSGYFISNNKTGIGSLKDKNIRIRLVYVA
jgi:hypothetical protein